MQTLLFLDIDPAALAELLTSVNAHGQVLAIRTLRDALAHAPVGGGLDLVAARALLAARGLTARQCDLVLLDVQGHTRAEIAERCELSPLTVKKYWLAIYARLGMHRRQSLRAWINAQCGMAIELPPEERGATRPKDPP